MFALPRVYSLYVDWRIEHAVTQLLAEAAWVAPKHSRLAMAQPPASGSRMRSAAVTPRSLELMDAVSDVFKLTKDAHSRRARHALASARYVIGDYAAAASEIEAAARNSDDAALWNDLAAARLESAIASNAPHDAVPALVAVDRALQLAPRFDAALYNRAAILESIGLRTLARDAWQNTLSVEANSQWQMTIRDALRRTENLSAEKQWAASLERLRVTSPESAAGVASEIAKRFPQQTRVRVELVLPSQWAEASMAGDRRTADGELRIARLLASALRENKQESLAWESILAIDSAITSDAHGLARAYLLYREGRILYSNHELAAAENRLRDAAHSFDAAASPMQRAAEYYAANTIADQGRTREAAALYENLAGQIDPERYRALSAQLNWQISIAEGRMGHWDAALDATKRSIAGFVRLGEKENAGATENLLAEQYDLLGQPERAWKHRATAFALLSEAGAMYRLQVALAGASRDRVRRKDWPASVTLLGLEIEVSRLAGDSALVADAMARRARARAALGDARTAMMDIASARDANAKIADASMRAKVGADIDVAEGVVVRRTNRSRSVQLLTSAIRYYTDSSSAFLLPELFLERGRTQRAHGLDLEALADFDRGIEQLEANRKNVTAFDIQTTVGDVDEDLFLEAVRVAVDRGDSARAFDYSERSRSRALLHRIGRSGDWPSMKTPPRVVAGVALVEFMVLDDRVVVFTLADELRMTAIPVDRAKLEAMVDELTTAIQKERSLTTVHESSQHLYDLLLRPMRPLLKDAKVAVFLPNQMLDRVPWAALYDSTSGRYVIEDAAVVTAPSVAYLGVAEAHPRSDARALVLGNPRNAFSLLDLPPLLAAEDEAKTIARLYRSPALLIGSDATRERFLREAGNYEVVHFGAHAISSEIDDAQSFLVLASAGDRDSGLLYAGEITQLRLERVKLLVLAACGTVRGPTVHLDGTPSIGRSFLAAGVEAVIGTLWDVDDERSAALFTHIHRSFASGRSPADALRDVQIRAIRSGNSEIAHPKTWAGVVVMGGAGPVLEARYE